MGKIRKRKQPITSSSAPIRAPSQHISGPNLIRKFHVLLKRKQALLARGTTSKSKELGEIEHEIASLGGLEMYQRMSVKGQNEDRGGGSDKVFITWLREEGVDKAGTPLNLLEVGALKPDNYSNCSSWIANTPIDLHSRHPLIKEQDFLKLDEDENTGRWDAISLSLVVNFVPDAHDRGTLFIGKVVESMLNNMYIL
ncbi:hypothetical protein M422DRAFT_181741 [Sphaerobolus stellatus SS14]|uniref:25S rRNA adenine-N(1) methyltransferase n=1 Tax=Sphaerobolus stellatus (strain SS14) TaxID=990650 RepID=A0A0C9VBB2_SPHS4|nr:hypothetical protein M422DRAFT_181741 [Sphaerobolus stellatus SS14]